MSRRAKKKKSVKKTILLILILLLVLVGIVFVIIKYVDLEFDSKLLTNDKTGEKNENYVVSISSNLSKIYLAVGATKILNVDFEVVGEPDKTLVWKSDNDGVVSVVDGVLTSNGVGETKVTATTINGKEVIFDVLVTDLITVPTLNNDKPYLPCHRYTKEEAALLDEILEARVNEAGYGTRGAAVAVARFILLEFPYTLRYFNENGRMSPGYPNIDGEGRYYHKGLYLDDSKFNGILASTASGPAIWGCNLYDAFIDRYHANGLTCSGFITWIFLNAGFETGDVGAGDYEWIDNELSDMGPHQAITYEFMKSGNYKVGDFIARDGHAALIMGISDTTIYTAESLPPKAEVYIYERYSGIVQDENLDYVINMDNIYPNGEGIYTDMW